MVPTENHFLGHFKMVTRSGLGTRLSSLCERVFSEIKHLFRSKHHSEMHRVANVHQQYQVMCIFLGGCSTMCKHQSDCKTE